jgi:hypothetical protein
MRQEYADRALTDSVRRVGDNRPRPGPKPRLVDAVDRYA